MIAKFSERIYNDLTKDLNELVLEENDLIKRLEKSIHICLKYLRKLKDYCKLNDPQTAEEEIQFFKHIKPRFKSQLIFFQALLNIEIRKPIGESRVIAEYYGNEITILNHFFASNTSFYQYVRTQATYLDSYYFVRGNYDVHLDPDQCMIDFDPSFSTTHDHKLAQVLASALLQEYLEEAIHRINQKETLLTTDVEFKDFDWKQTKCALIELIYSWHATEAFGKKNLKSIVKFIERSFNISLGNFYDTFDWVCGRSSPTLYIDEMKEAFLLRVQKKLK
ncbi:RteC domain-containing protein [Mucilaginibacter ginkgonis]|uniref:RteC domain-containing protein n=1 Tax=Mucilaginibacter ginkgonis TaxID=2682091 RepID=A0A6I4IMN9_9SPHI|nr:RteC domain-containing protein [Mucilaginibacter ginkgonis]QQL49971.1 RteC domain-containing protein [Mucilaginibacter ginkgonis]